MTYTALILSIAKSVGVPGYLFLAICTHESGLRNVIVSQDNGSPSYGLCQIKESTGKMLGFQGTTEEFKIPQVNVLYAARYLKMQLERYNGDLCKAIAAYNSGTFNPSKADPEKPRNLGYIKRIRLILNKEFKDFIICGPRNKK